MAGIENMKKSMMCLGSGGWGWFSASGVAVHYYGGGRIGVTTLRSMVGLSELPAQLTPFSLRTFLSTDPPKM